MAQMASALHSPVDVPKRPKGILKNSFQHSPPDVSTSPTAVHSPPAARHESPVLTTTHSGDRPGLPPRELSEKEITQMNTELNAGGHRRTSSNPRGSVSRRQSSQSTADGAADAEHNMRLKWDEANLWLNEGQMGGKMKIDEPKTPFAKQYDPSEDEEEISSINAQEIAVDELDMEKSKSTPSTKKVNEDEIPGLDIGEPELEPRVRRESDGDRRVTVDENADQDGLHHGEEDEAGMSNEELAKHRKFEQMRKKHYEMKNVRNLLGHPEKLDELEDDEK